MGNAKKDIMLFGVAALGCATEENHEEFGNEHVNSFMENYDLNILTR